jgi:AcrR family transcriptional regulator
MSPTASHTITEIPEQAKPRAAERILRTARDLFYREGIRAVGVEEIVARAGVTKPSLYRSYASKDELAASYLALYEQEFWARFNGAMGADAPDPRAQLLDYLEGLAERAIEPDYRGCGLSNAAVEYPEEAHPARRVGARHKRELRTRLREMAARMGAHDPALLGDGLMLLLEGTFLSGQMFHGEGPAANVARAAALLIDASVERSPKR